MPNVHADAAGRLSRRASRKLGGGLRVLRQVEQRATGLHEGDAWRLAGGEGRLPFGAVSLLPHYDILGSGFEWKHSWFALGR